MMNILDVLKVCVFVKEYDINVLIFKEELIELLDFVVKVFLVWNF